MIVDLIVSIIDKLASLFTIGLKTSISFMRHQIRSDKFFKSNLSH